MVDVLSGLWSLCPSLSLTDWLTLLYILILLMAVLISNHLFKVFLAAKPEGRKTVLGWSLVIQMKSSLVIYICYTIRSWEIIFFYVLRQSPRNWKTMMHQNVLPIFFTHHIYITTCGKLSKLNFYIQFFSKRGEKVLKSRKTIGQICPVNCSTLHNLLPAIREQQYMEMLF